MMLHTLVCASLVQFATGAMLAVQFAVWTAVAAPSGVAATPYDSICPEQCARCNSFCLCAGECNGHEDPRYPWTSGTCPTQQGLGWGTLKVQELGAKASDIWYITHPPSGSTKGVVSGAIRAILDLQGVRYRSVTGHAEISAGRGPDSEIARTWDSEPGVPRVIGTHVAGQFLPPTLFATRATVVVAGENPLYRVTVTKDFGQESWEQVTDKFLLGAEVNKTDECDIWQKEEYLRYMEDYQTLMEHPEQFVPFDQSGIAMAVEARDDRVLEYLLTPLVSHMFRGDRHEVCRAMPEVMHTMRESIPAALADHVPEPYRTSILDAYADADLFTIWKLPSELPWDWVSCWPAAVPAAAQR